MTWLDSPLGALDTETTGTDPETARVVTACVGMSMAPGQWSPMEWRLNPGVPIPAGAAAVHGITDADVTDWSAPADALAEGDFVELLGPSQSLADVARDADTIAYEILTQLGPRHARIA